MWLLYADETNLDPKHEWFVYGGIAIPGDRVEPSKSRSAGCAPDCAPA